MRLTTIAAAAALALSMTGAALAQGAPGGNGSGGNIKGGSTTPSSKADTLNNGGAVGSTDTNGAPAGKPMMKPGAAATGTTKPMAPAAR